MIDVNKLMDCVQELRTKNAKLREALEFYAKSNNYTCGPNGQYGERDTVMEFDRGKVARAALAAKDEAGK